jgi:hypothetical protein
LFSTTKSRLCNAGRRVKAFGRACDRAVVVRAPVARTDLACRSCASFNYEILSRKAQCGHALVDKICSHIAIPSRCRTMIRIASHPRQIPYEGYMVRGRRCDLNVRRTRGGKRQQPFGSATRVCVLRRVGPPHGGAYVGMFAAAQGAIRGVSILKLRAGSPGTPASPGQANLGCPGMRNPINRDRCERSCERLAV